MFTDDVTADESSRIVYSLAILAAKEVKVWQEISKEETNTGRHP